MRKMIVALAMAIPIGVGAFPDIRMDTHSCHAVHHREFQQFVTQLPRCEVTFHAGWAGYQQQGRILFAVGKTRRFNVPRNAVPFEPPAPDPDDPFDVSCELRNVNNTYKCWVFDHNSKLHLSRRAWWTNVQVCSIPGETDEYDVTYEVACDNNTPATPEEAECVRKIVAGEIQLNTPCAGLG